VAQHLICLTIDTDPDGLNTHDPDRHTLAWDGLHFAIEHFHAVLPEIPLTWYVRADGQLERAYGSVSYLLDTYADFWRQALTRGDELGWHPHLYTIEPESKIITDSAQAVTELSRIWQLTKDSEFPLPTFRMGEAWHTTETLNLLEQLGFQVDSTAIPGRDDSASGHPRNWSGTPNHPYYPSKNDVRIASVGAIHESPLHRDNTYSVLEVPMNSWYFKASYDPMPKLRYMNPCIHSGLWQQGLNWWEANLPDHQLHIWNLILHPAEAMPHDKPDMLYAYSLDVIWENLQALVKRIEKRGDTASYTTINRASSQWREQNFST
jgi:hypothetical protein